MRYEVETFEKTLGLFNFEDVYDEVNKSRYGVPMRIDYMSYDMLDGSLDTFCLVAYDGDTPAGFISVMLLESMHNGIVSATNDCFYVKPEYRSGYVAGKLLKMAEQKVHDRGINWFLWNVPPGSPLDKALSKRPAYTKESVSYIRRL